VRFGENPEVELPGPGAYEIKNEVRDFGGVLIIEFL